MEKAKQNEINKDYNKAVTNYDILLRLHSKSPLRQEAMCRKALAYIVGMNDIGQARQIFEQIMEEYPEPLYAEGSQTMLDFMKTKGTRDTAAVPDDEARYIEMLYQSGLIYTNLLQDYSQAERTFQKIIDEHPGMKYAPLAQFMIGFVYANNASDLTKAKQAYETFLEKYPDHELVPSVKWELTYLGKDINDIPELNQPENAPAKEAVGQ